MFTKILIANRGEIACRVIHTARRMGIKTVAVYSDADANAQHVKLADEAYRLGPPPARESYLLGDKIIAIAKQAGAQAIHPGYGFLSENETFAQACATASLVFIGPPASAIAAMGSKSAAKSLMDRAQVPLVPGYHGDCQEASFLAAQADRIGYPVLIKASAGGGGKGMRIVRRAEEFNAALSACQREASASFGDARVLIEKYLTKPRHIEVQVFADSMGHCVYLFERDCSVQRRHQKVIEEAPAPGMTEALRARMGEAAVAAAKAVGYVGAGTVEFIAEAAEDGSAGPFYFMEMNTRLQVEHPVTEMITGLDLVEWQLRVAAGQSLPLSQDQLRINGHAIEARIYSENPFKEFLPATGPIHHLRTPEAVQFTTGQPAHPLGGVMSGEPAATRVDSAIVKGSQISPYYDPMIAKLIVWGSDRPAAIARMSSALQQFEVAPLVTNIEFLQNLMRSPSFTGGNLDTALIERERNLLLNPKRASLLRAGLLATAACLGQLAGTCSTDPWSQLRGFNLHQAPASSFTWELDDQCLKVEVSYNRSGYGLHWILSQSDAAPQSGTAWLAEVSYDQHSGQLACQISGLIQHDPASELSNQTIHERVVRISSEGSAQWAVFQDAVPTLIQQQARLHWADSSGVTAGSITAPMPGKIVALLATAGSEVKKGEALLVMEAMKMEHTLHAPRDGKLEAFLFRVGDQVAEGAQLVQLN